MNSIINFFLMLFKMIIGKYVHTEKDNKDEHKKPIKQNIGSSNVSGEYDVPKVQIVKKTGQITIDELRNMIDNIMVIDIIPKNAYSRVGHEIIKEETFALHYVGSPGATAEQTHKYFKGLANQSPDDDKRDRYASTHFSVDEKNIFMTVPCSLFCELPTEKAYHVGAFPSTQSKGYYEGARVMTKKSLDRFEPINPKGVYLNPNNFAVGMEMSHIDAEGTFTKETLYNAKLIVTYWCIMRGKNPLEDVWRHYDYSGKGCPRYFVNHESAYLEYLKEIDEFMKKVIV